MEVAKIAQYARSLYNAHGDKAEAEAAQRAKAHEEKGEHEEAETWRSIQVAIKEIRGARAT